MKCNKFFLYFASIVANLFSFTIGCLLVWNSPVIPKLQSNQTDVNPLETPITTLQVSISTSIIPVGSAIGTLLVGKIAEIFGRRRILIYLASGASFSFTALFFVGHIYFYWTFMFIISMCISGGFVIAPVYVAEISEPHNRGKLGCFLSVAVAVGELYAYIVGPLTSVGHFSILCGIPSYLFLLFCVFIPESPIFSISKGDKSGAMHSLKKLRQNNNLEELETKYGEIERMMLIVSKEETTDTNVLFRTRYGRKALLLSIGVRIIQQLSGIFVVLSFLAPLFKEAGSQLSGETLTIIITSINIPISLLALNIIERVGRKNLMLTACFFCSVSLFILGFYFYFKENDFFIPDSIRILPIVCLFCYFGMFTLGLGNVPFVIISEILPNEVRSVGSSFVLVTGNLSAFAISFAYPLVSEYLGTYVSIMAFGFFCFAGFIFVLLFLPETKGKSFLDIRKELDK